MKNSIVAFFFLGFTSQVFAEKIIDFRCGGSEPSFSMTTHGNTIEYASPGEDIGDIQITERKIKGADIHIRAKSKEGASFDIIISPDKSCVSDGVGKSGKDTHKIKFTLNKGTNVGCCSAILSTTAEKITESNWQKHPEIVAVKKIYEMNQKSRKQWSTSTKKWEYCEPYVDTSRSLTASKNGQPRIYIHSGGSEDSSATLEHHYDDKGQLRFVFITGGAMNESKLEQRIYFNEAGERVWEMQKYTAGPGYTFPNPWPKKELTFDPKAAFSATNKCGKD
ncbi:MAG: hypothetical protein AB7O96_18450 [Pseudobdellovibrionaceae bacterium]